MFDIEANVKKLPEVPGVYLHKDSTGKVIYVGKANNLKKRVQSYFSKTVKSRKVVYMVRQITEFEYIVTANEKEALILECNLIKKYMPRYNVLLTDDKTYPYIKISEDEEYPRITKTRRIEKDGAKYFGPYSDEFAANEIMDLLNKIYRLKRCKLQKFPDGMRACLNYHIGQCDGMCIGKGNREDYLDRIEKAKDFLQGRDKSLIHTLRKKMQEASDGMLYESAAMYRDYITSAKSILEKQSASSVGMGDIDVLVPIVTDTAIKMLVFFIRDGKTCGREIYNMQQELAEGEEALLEGFIQQNYVQGAYFPDEIVLGYELNQKELLEELLHEFAGKKVYITCPVRGKKRELLKMAKKDAEYLKGVIKTKDEASRERKKELSYKLGRILNEMNGGRYEYGFNDAGEEYTVEAYDISNINGIDNVAGMVVFTGFAPEKSRYRKFKIKSIEGQDDYGSMREVLFRRFTRYKEGAPGFSDLPDIIFMDGGRGHVNAALDVLKYLDLEIPVIGMAKDDKHRTKELVYKVGDNFKVYPLVGSDNFMLAYVGRIQEEVHRYAISYHISLRDRSMTKSILENIEGVGPKKRAALLKKWGTIEAIEKASAEELEATEGINLKLALKIKEFFKNYRQK